jgi:probable F420-dependent oxidoreductase
MDNISRFGVFLPTYIWADDGPERARNIVAFSKRVEELGFDSLFVTDHLLSAHHFYSASFLEPLSTLAVAAGATERVRLGTSVLVLPTRQPVVLAKELSTLQYLSNNRFILGAGVGWNQAEFRATGGDKSQRGRRTDEILDIAIPLMEGETVTYHGKYFQVDEVSIEPRPTRRPELWIGGGSQLANEKSPDKPMLVPAVKERILKAEGWIPRPTCPPEDQARDWEEIQVGMRERGRDISQFTVAHENFMHFVDTADGDRARREQHEAFLKVMSSTRGPEYLESVYLFGTPEEIVGQLQARVEAGIGYFMLHTMTPDIDQLDLWVRDIVPNVKFPVGAPAGQVAAA